MLYSDMEHRIALTKQEAFKLSALLKIKGTSFVKDEYTGTKRIRTEGAEVTEIEYKTPIKGVIYRYSSHCELGDIKNIWFEYKWTAKTNRFEIEFENEVPNKFKDRENVKGWEILR